MPSYVKYVKKSAPLYYGALFQAKCGFLFILSQVYCTHTPFSSTLFPSGVVVFVSIAPSAPR